MNRSTLFRSFSLPKLGTQQLVVLALLMALDMVLGRLSVGTNMLRISFGFVAISLIAKLYGPLWTMLVAAVLDIVGATIISPNGNFFFGFTLSAIVAGLIYGTAYYGYEHTRLLRVVIAVILVSIIINLISNTLWLQMMYHPISNWQTFYAFITPRLIKQIIFVPIQILITYIFLNNAIIKHLITELFNKKS
ncbi:folate family ECF transporter S component [Leuconostoc fallax]|uniref:Folate family ECF transporter S component n=1 Tax=Leuconostoc fallax TaxID=1251 RepID=A0A4R5N9Q4_9LACO|nr:folate family ECF transporter S component [Leuconostoc fallax]MBU7455990.1 folate family ECF transporter S component [Leuconostoc fallax]MCO6184330.1 folate family ECF transporter S component [Leuconostoc fallax]TDG68834.1 hypothetical protein C5L23_000753 [Leuconostoc fallax]